MNAVAIPIPRYAVGQVVFYASTHSSSDRFDCPDCLGQKQWTVTSPAGGEWKVSCVRCGGAGTIGCFKHAGDVVRLTIGSIRINTYISHGDDEHVEYMCNETGVGSGSIYRESRLFPDEASAKVYADLLGHEATERHYADEDRKKERQTFITLSQYQLREASVKEAQDAVWEANFRLTRLLEHICELDEHPSGFNDEANDMRFVTLTREQVEVVQEHIVKYHERGKKFLLDWRQRVNS